MDFMQVKEYFVDRNRGRDNQGIYGIHAITTSFKKGYNTGREEKDDNQDGKRMIGTQA